MRGNMLATGPRLNHSRNAAHYKAVLFAWCETALTVLEWTNERAAPTENSGTWFLKGRNDVLLLCRRRELMALRSDLGPNKICHPPSHIPPGGSLEFRVATSHLENKVQYFRQKPQFQVSRGIYTLCRSHHNRSS